MNKTKFTASTCLLALASSMPLLAEEVASEETDERNWKAAVELGFVQTSGNSETENLNVKVDASTAYHSWEHKLHLETLNSSSNDVRSAEKYLAEGQSDYFINERTYGLGVVTWEKDKFDGFDYQASIALGMGYKVIQDADMQLSVELAPGYRVSEFESGNNEEDGIIRAAEAFSWKLTENSTLDQTFSTEVGDSNTVTRFGVAITSQVAGDLSMKVGYYLKHNSDVADGIDKTDRETSVTLVYKI
ncbi:MAG: putative salt-induced outer membrane protein [Oleiphilaceae bacterium]|jgi:putative salt-induced outer membrane protein